MRKLNFKEVELRTKPLALEVGGRPSAPKTERVGNQVLAIKASYAEAWAD